MLQPNSLAMRYVWRIVLVDRAVLDRAQAALHAGGASETIDRALALAAREEVHHERVHHERVHHEKAHHEEARREEGREPAVGGMPPTVPLAAGRAAAYAVQ